MKKDEIKKLRRALKLTQEQFAHLIGATFSTINRWENGRSSPRGLYIKALEDIKKQTVKKVTLN
jgi:DNA-binding transcriptional regulator YiaG